MTKEQSATQVKNVFEIAGMAYNGIKATMEELAKYPEAQYTHTYIEQKMKEQRERVSGIVTVALEKIRANLEKVFESETENAEMLDLAALQPAIAMISAMGDALPLNQVQPMLEPFKGYGTQLDMLTRLLRKNKVVFVELPWYKVDVSGMFNDLFDELDNPSGNAMEEIQRMNGIRSHVYRMAELLAIPAQEPEFDALAEDATAIIAKAAMGL